MKILIASPAHNYGVYSSFGEFLNYLNYNNETIVYKANNTKDEALAWAKIFKHFNILKEQEFDFTVNKPKEFVIPLQYINSTKQINLLYKKYEDSISEWERSNELNKLFKSFSKSFKKLDFKEVGEEKIFEKLTPEEVIYFFSENYKFLYSYKKLLTKIEVIEL